MEELHSKGGIQLFLTLCDENNGLQKEIENEVYEAAKMVFDVESKFIDSIFNDLECRTITAYDLKEFLKHRINTKLTALKYNPLYSVDREAINRMSWFDSLSSGREFGDFFAVRVSEYTSVEFNANDLF